MAIFRKRKLSFIKTPVLYLLNQTLLILRKPWLLNLPWTSADEKALFCSSVGRWFPMPYDNISNSSVFSPQCFLLDMNFNSTKSLFTAHILTSVINSISSFTAVAGNAAVFLAVWKTPALQTPSNVFLCCLAFSDLTVGLVAQPCFVIHKIGELLHSFNMYCATRILTESLGYITAGTSVLTMTGIAIERYLALYLHLRYQEIITTKRILIAASLIWIFFILLAASRFWIANDSVFNNISIPLIFSSLIFTFLAYTKVLKYVRQHESQIKEQNLNTACPDICPTNYRMAKIKRYKKSTLTMVYIVGIFIVCYIPFLSVKIVHKFKGYTVSVKTAYLYASTIVFLNSSFNPVFYCWRITDIRRAVKEVCSRCFGAKDEVVTMKASVAFHRRSRVSSINITRASVSFMPSWLYSKFLNVSQDFFRDRKLLLRTWKRFGLSKSLSCIETGARDGTLVGTKKCNQNLTNINLWTVFSLNKNLGALLLNEHIDNVGCFIVLLVKAI